MCLCTAFAKISFSVEHQTNEDVNYKLATSKNTLYNTVGAFRLAEILHEMHAEPK